jgi:hypothetical protein
MISLNALRDCVSPALSTDQELFPACLASDFICFSAASISARRAAATLLAASWNLSAASRQALACAAAMSLNVACCLRFAISLSLS